MSTAIYSSSESEAFSRAGAILAQLVERPPPRTPFEWPEQVGRMMPQGSPRPGRWDNLTVPYLEAPARAVCDPNVLAVVLATPAQSAKTEFLFHCLGFNFTDVRVPAIYVGPSRKQARSVMRSRIEPFFDSVPLIAEFLDRRRGYQSVEEKYIAGLRFGLAWAGSSSELKSHPAGLVVVDEIDEMKANIGGAGDPFLLALARVKAYRNGTGVAASTPTVEGDSPIHDWWEQGSMHRWLLTCLHCEAEFWPALALLRWPKGATPAEARDGARLVCDTCGAEHTDAERLKMPGRWVAHRKVDQQYEPIDLPVLNPIRSYHVNWAGSRLTPMGDVAYYLRAAYDSREPDKIQAVVNQMGGELYRVRGDAPAWETVRGCIAATPERVQLVTAGVDVQKDGLWVLVRGWMHPDATSHRLAWTFLRGDPEFDSVWIALGQALGMRYAGLPVALAFIDSGYRPGDRYVCPENQVYKYAMRHAANTRPTKGRDILPGGEKQKASQIDYIPAGKRDPIGLQLWHVNTHYYKQTLYGLIRRQGEPPGAWHVPPDVEDSYCKQVTNEQLVILSSGGHRWIRTGDRQNHALDCEVLARAAADVLNVEFLPSPRGPDPAPPPPPVAPVDPSLERQSL